jgi:hypothetical protein
MKVTYQKGLSSSTFKSWQRDDKTTLLVSHTDTGVSLQHIDSRFSGAESVVVCLSRDEALDIGKRIQQILLGERLPPTFYPDDCKSNPTISVTQETDGDPYREGVALDLRAGDWDRDFHFVMNKETAKELSGDLLRASEAVPAPNEMNLEEVIKALEEVTKFINIAWEYDGDVFRRHHNDATDATSNAERLINEYRQGQAEESLSPGMS